MTSSSRDPRPQPHAFTSFTRSATLTLALSASLALATVAGAQPAVSDPKIDPMIGTLITITGCLHAGEEAGSFVLLNVTERPAAGEPKLSAPVPYAIYRLDSTDGLEKLVGQFVDVTGKVLKRDEKPGTITRDVDPGVVKSDTVEVAANDDSVTSEKFKGPPKPKGASASPTTAQVVRPVYKLDVKEVSATAHSNPLAPACH